MTPAHDDRLHGCFLPSVFGYASICLTALFFSCLFIDHPAGVPVLIQEDTWVENFTAIGLFLAGVLLFATARLERNTVRRCVYILGGLMMMFGVGEEINWGQRIFGFNSEIGSEFSLHNLPEMSRLFNRSLLLAPSLLCMVALTAFFCHKDRLFGIPLPSIFLVLCFLMATINKTHPDFDNMQNLIFHYMRYIHREHNTLLLVLLFFTLFSRQSTFFIATSAILAFTCARWYAFSHGGIYLTYSIKSEEIQEFLLGLSCFFYALELFGRSLDREGRVTTSPRKALPFVRKFGERIASASSLSMNVRLSTIKGICTLIVAGSIGLAALGYFSPAIATAFVKEGYSRIEAAEPIIRSEFDVYLIDNQLIHFKTPCAPSDIRERFFLHVVPADANDLIQGQRREFGFDNFDRHASLRLDATHAGGRCLSVVPLPDYDIASIGTGQFTREGKSWHETFRFIEQPG